MASWVNDKPHDVANIRQDLFGVKLVRGLPVMSVRLFWSKDTVVSSLTRPTYTVCVGGPSDADDVLVGEGRPVMPSLVDDADSSAAEDS